MAELDPQAQPLQTGNYLGYSKGVLVDTSLGGLFQDAATGITAGARAAKDITESAIHDQVREAIEPVRDAFIGRNALGRGPGDVTVAGVGDGEARTPELGARTIPEMETYQRRLQQLRAAYANGTLQDSHYWMLLDMEARQIRARFPGSRETVDRIIQETVGVTPANRLVAEIAQEGRATRASSETEYRHWLHRATELSTPSALLYQTLVSQGRTPSVLQLQNEVARQMEVQNRTTRARADLELQHAEGVQNREGAVRAAREALYDRWHNTFSTVTGVVPNWQRALDEARRTGRLSDPATLQRLSEQFNNEIRGPAEAAFHSILFTAPRGRQPFATLINDAATTNGLLTEFNTMLNNLSRDVAHGNHSALQMMTDQSNAYRHGDLNAAMAGPHGPAFRNAQVIQQILGNQFFGREVIEQWMPTLERAVRFQFRVNDNDAVVNGLPLSQIVERYRNATAQEQGVIANAHVGAMVGQLSAQGMLPDAIARYATPLFGPGNLNFLDRVSNRSEIYQRMVGSPELARNMESIRNTHPQVYQQYDRWVVQNFQSAIRESAANLNNHAYTGAGGARVVWHPTTNQFVVSGENTNNIQNDVNNINRAIQGYTNLLTAQGHTNQDTAHLLALQMNLTNNGQGINPNRTAEPTHWGRMLDHIQNFAGRLNFSNMVYDQRRPDTVGPLSPTGGQATHYAPLLNIIARGESGQHGENAIFNANRQSSSNPRLSQMTLAEVLGTQEGVIRAQRANNFRSLDENVAIGRPNAPARSSAAGRYQFTQEVLRNTASQMGLDLNTTVFNRDTQDRMALHILNRMGLQNHLQNPTDESRARLMDRMSGFWAALPDSRGQGRINVGGNRANQSREAFESAIRQMEQLYSPNRPGAPPPSEATPPLPDPATGVPPPRRVTTTTEPAASRSELTRGTTGQAANTYDEWIGSRRQIFMDQAERTRYRRFLNSWGMTRQLGWMDRFEQELRESQ